MLRSYDTLQDIADALNDGTIREIIRGYLRSTNDGAAHTSGYDADDIFGQADECVADIRDALLDALGKDTEGEPT